MSRSFQEGGRSIFQEEKKKQQQQNWRATDSNHQYIYEGNMMMILPQWVF